MSKVPLYFLKAKQTGRADYRGAQVWGIQGCLTVSYKRNTTAFRSVLNLALADVGEAGAHTALAP